MPLEYENRPDTPSYGMSGECFACAIAIQKYCFPNAKIVLAVNSYRWNSEGDILGHCAVFHNGKYYDQEGEKDWSLIECWGMLDPHLVTEEYGLPFEQANEIACEVERFELSPQGLLQLIDKNYMKNYELILNRYKDVAHQKEQKCQN